MKMMADGVRGSFAAALRSHVPDEHGSIGTGGEPCGRKSDGIIVLDVFCGAAGRVVIIFYYASRQGINESSRFAEDKMKKFQLLAYYRSDSSRQDGLRSLCFKQILDDARG